MAGLAPEAFDNVTMGGSTVCREVLRTILLDLGIEERLITDHARLFSDLKIDSTEAVEIVLSLKKSLGVSITIESKVDPKVADICALVDSSIVSECPPG